MAMSTWPKGIKPVVHYSESAIGKMPQAHSDYIFDKINTYGYDLDIEVEAKMKELAVLTYLNKYGHN
jgi:UV DNA damage endonuclease